MTTEELKKAFKDTEANIQKYAQNTPKYNSLLRYCRSVKSYSVRELKTLQRKVNEYKTVEIKRIYKERIAEIKENLIQQYTDAGADVPNLSEIPDDLDVTTAQANCDVYLTTAISKAQQTIEQLVTETEETEQTMAAAREKISAKIANGIPAGQCYSNGTLMNLMLSAYGKTCINGIDSELCNNATLNFASTNEYDLVQISQHFGSCPICVPYEGRVYTRTGADTRFPYLYDTPWSDSFENLHPNCRHQLLIYVEDLQTTAYHNEMLRFSNRSFDFGGDGWTKADIKKAQASLDAYYARQQRLRDLYNDRDQYNKYVARLGANAPKTFAAFRSIKAAGGKAWQELQAKFRAAGKGVTPSQPIKVITPVVKPTRVATALETQVPEKKGTIAPTGSYAKMLNDKYAQGTDTAKIVYDKNIPSNGGVVVDNKESDAFHQSGRIYMDYKEDETHPARKGATWFHEHGHYIDYINDVNKYSGYTNTSWGRQFQTTVIDEVRAYEQAYKASHGFKYIGETRQAIGRELMNNEYKTMGVQDAFGGATVGHYPCGKYRTCWGHSKSYYSQRSVGVAQETFANMFEANFDSEKAAAFKQYLPKSWKMFTDKLEELAK